MSKNTTVTTLFTVKFEIHLINDAKVWADSLYICGNDKKLGEWNPEKAILLKKTKENTYALSKKFKAGTLLEFKILNGKSWENVEKGALGEEMSNHIFEVNEDLTAPVVVSKWN